MSRPSRADIGPADVAAFRVFIAWRAIVGLETFSL